MRNFLIKDAILIQNGIPGPTGPTEKRLDTLQTLDLNSRMKYSLELCRTLDMKLKNGWPKAQIARQLGISRPTVIAFSQKKGGTYERYVKEWAEFQRLRHKYRGEPIPVPGTDEELHREPPPQWKAKKKAFVDPHSGDTIRFTVFEKPGEEPIYVPDEEA